MATFGGSHLVRTHSDAVNIKLLRQWLAPRFARVLKTDLFDEAVGGGLYPELASRAETVVGVDISGIVVGAAVRRHPALVAEVASVLALPFAPGSFDVVVSNSSLDHFESRTTLRASIADLARVLRRGGELVITLDNRTNPVIAARTSVLATPLRRLGVVPYYVGVTCGARGLVALLGQNGFEVVEVALIMHCPPQLAAHLAARRCDRVGEARVGEVGAERRHLRRVLALEAMGRWPTRHVTGHFVAARAVRL
ncbi:MAG: hypothetical protein DLM54_08535 [Acidimicrobiales bacterium]|nr:MAG: hypothetical protein DLM54_08535 [Acidimicrobiales bacterium]